MKGIEIVVLGAVVVLIGAVVLGRKAEDVGSDDDLVVASEKHQSINTFTPPTGSDSGSDISDLTEDQREKFRKSLNYWSKAFPHKSRKELRARARQMALGGVHLTKEEGEYRLAQRAKANRRFATKSEVNGFIASEGESAINYALTGLLIDDMSLWDEATKRWPESSEALLSRLLADEGYANAEEIERLRELSPDSAWPDIFLAAAALDGKDINGALDHLRAAIDGVFSDRSRGFEEPLAAFLESVRGTDPGDARAPNAALNAVSADLYLSRFMRNVLQSAPDNNLAAATGLSLAETWSSSPGLRATSEWEAATAERDFLTALGPENATEFLTVPYMEALADIQARRSSASRLMDDVTEYRATLSGAELSEFNERAATLGERIAYAGATAPD